MFQVKEQYEHLHEFVYIIRIWSVFDCRSHSFLHWRTKKFFVSSAQQMEPQSGAHLISINIQLFLFCNKKNGRRNYEIMYLIMVVGFELDSNLDIDNSQCWLTYLSSVHDIQVIISAKCANEHAANFDSLGALISIEWTGKKKWIRKINYGNFNIWYF